LGELGPHLTQCCLVEAYLHAEFHFDLSKRLATIRQRHIQTERQTGQDRQDRTTV